MNTEHECCGNCKYFAANSARGAAEVKGAMGECVNSESDYANRDVSASFCCEMFESRLET